jgi:hypothetical protein
MKIDEHIPLLEGILEEWHGTIGSQYEPYKNHVYRVVHFCFALHQCTQDDREKFIIAGCFHDLGIWPGDIVDYLAPSIELAKKYLKENGKEEWSTEIELMIDLHHKITKVKNCEHQSVEVFRKGDWVDVSLGMRSFDLPRIGSALFGGDSSRLGAEYRYAMGIGASLMAGWTALLVWGAINPIERRDILILTLVPVVAGIIAATVIAIRNRLVLLSRVIPLWIHLGFMSILFVVSYVLSFYVAN